MSQMWMRSMVVEVNAGGAYGASLCHRLWL